MAACSPSGVSGVSCPGGQLPHGLLYVVRAIVVGVPILWLFAAALWLDVEGYDGYDTICNTYYFCGRSDAYLSNRAPLLAWLLMPASGIRSGLGLDPMDLRPYHVEMALFHAIFLVCIYRWLERRLGRTLPALVAFTAAMLPFAFFSFSPYLSHDILPGGLFLLMLVLAEEFRQTPSARRWLALVILGASGPLIKQTYGVFWVGVLAGCALPLAYPLRGMHRGSWRVFSLLCLGAVSSLGFYWVCMGWVLGGSYPTLPFLVRPWEQITNMLMFYRRSESPPYFPVWVYVRNLPFYGVLMCMLVVPALFKALRGTRFMQSVAVAWLVSVVALHVYDDREVRYLAFLMPLSAVLIGPIVVDWGRRRDYLITMVCVLCIDVSVSISEAAHVFDPFYGRSQLRQMLDVLADDSGPRLPVWFAKDNYPVFLPPQNSPLAGDRFHRLFYVAPFHIAILLGRAPGTVVNIYDFKYLQRVAGEEPRSALLMVTCTIYSSLSLSPEPPTNLDKYAVYACQAERLAVTVGVDGLTMPDGSLAEWSLCADSVPDVGAVTLEGDRLDALILGQYLFPVLRNMRTRESWPLVRDAQGRYSLNGLARRPGGGTAPDLHLYAFRIRHVCSAAEDRPGTVVRDLPPR